ncbi:hypothetical protein JRQ81_007765 [Phrynocephalus forsythii]|uniref:Uncharacterized protein n=1 Tax=Phrynocephalus forsythii TaxID=171643 RepID=A0A9Q0XC64_9SAUR|nr:hypothetical protein JRQ81_007765 [Phrynocephalus forsythii]
MLGFCRDSVPWLGIQLLPIKVAWPTETENFSDLNRNQNQRVQAPGHGEAEEQGHRSGLQPGPSSFLFLLSKGEDPMHQENKNLMGFMFLVGRGHVEDRIYASSRGTLCVVYDAGIWKCSFPTIYPWDIIISSAFKALY